MTDDRLERELRAWLAEEADAASPPPALRAHVTGVTSKPARQLLLFGRLALPMAVVAGIVISVIGGGLVRPLLPGTSNTPGNVASATPIATSTSSPPPSGTPPPMPAPTAVPLPTNAVAVDDPGPLVLRFEAFSETGRHAMYSIYEDGTLLSSGTAGDPDVSIVHQQLTPGAVDRLTATVVDTGLFDVSGDYPPVARPGAELPAYGGGGFRITSAVDSAPVVVWWSPIWPDEADWGVPSPTREALDALLPRLFPLTDVLAAGDFVDATPAPMRATRFGIYVTVLPWGGAESALLLPDINGFESPVGDLLTWGDVAISRGAGALARCDVVDAAMAADLFYALFAYGAERAYERDRVGLAEMRLGDHAGRRIVDVLFIPLLPDQPNTCVNTHAPPIQMAFGQFAPIR